MLSIISFSSALAPEPANVRARPRLSPEPPKNPRAAGARRAVLRLHKAQSLSNYVVSRGGERAGRRRTRPAVPPRMRAAAPRRRPPPTSPTPPPSRRPQSGLHRCQRPRGAQGPRCGARVRQRHGHARPRALPGPRARPPPRRRGGAPVGEGGPGDVGRRVVLRPQGQGGRQDARDARAQRRPQHGRLVELVLHAPPGDGARRRPRVGPLDGLGERAPPLRASPPLASPRPLAPHPAPSRRLAPP